MSGAAPMSRAQQLLRVGPVLFGLATAALAATASLTLAGGPRLLPLAQAYDQGADKAVTPAQAVSLSRAALAVRPVDVGAWVRLAALEAPETQAGASPAALQALDRSYDVGPYATQVLETRVKFAYEHWGALSPDLQAQTISEVKAAWPVGPQQQRLLAVASRVKNPLGAVALSGLLFSLKMHDDVAADAAKSAALSGSNQ